jgi:hypothetical protein
MYDRKEVVVMTTTTKRTTTKNSNNAKAPDKKVWADTVVWVKAHVSHVFVIYLALLTFLATIALQANGFRGEYVYDDALVVIVGIFNVAIMAYPAYLAIKSRQMLRVAIIVTTLLLMFFVLPIVVRLPGFGSALWEIPALGPIILPVAALAFNAFVAFTLAVDEPKGPDTAVEIKASILSIEGNIVKAQEAFDLANANSAASAETESEAKRKFKKKSGGSKQGAKNYVENHQALLDSPNAKKEAEYKQKLDELTRLLDQAQAELQEAGLAHRQATAKEIQDRIAEHQAKLTVEFNNLRDDHKKLVEKLEEVIEAIKVSPEKKAEDAALAASDKANKATNKAKIGYEIAINAALEASNKDATAATALESLERNLADTKARYTEATQSQKSKWRDVAFWPIIWLMLSLALYPVWYGWVVVNFAAI